MLTQQFLIFYELKHNRIKFLIQKNTFHDISINIDEDIAKFPKIVRE